MRERSSSDSNNHSSLQRQFSHGHSQKSDDGGSGSGTRISHFLPTSRRIVQFSNGKVLIVNLFLDEFRNLNLGNAQNLVATVICNLKICIIVL